MGRGHTETVLVASHIDEEREQLTGTLRRAGYGVLVAAEANEALEAYTANPTALVIADHKLPGKDSTVFVGLLRAQHPDAVVIVLCADANIEDTVALMKEGAAVVRLPNER